MQYTEHQMLPDTNIFLLKFQYQFKKCGLKVQRQAITFLCLAKFKSTWILWQMAFLHINLVAVVFDHGKIIWEFQHKN